MIDMMVAHISNSESFVKVETQDLWTTKGVLIVEPSEVKFRIGTELFE